MDTDPLVEQLRERFNDLAQAGDDIADMAWAFVETKDVNGLRNVGRNIASMARAAAALDREKGP